MKDLRIALYLCFFGVGWYYGMAQAWWHKYFIACGAAYIAGAIIRMLGA